MRFRFLFIVILLFLPSLSFSFSGKNCVPIIKENERLANYNYLIAKGVFNEFLPNYMTYYKDYLNDLGVPKSQIKTVSNYSAAIPQGSAKHLKNAVLSFDNKKETIILSHSKGALESLYMLIKNEDIREKIYKAVLLQGPLQGVSSYELTYGKAGDDLASKSFLFSFFRIVTKTPFISERFKNFSKVMVIKYFNYPLLKKENLIDKLLFVRTYKLTREMNWKMQYLGGLYKTIMKVKSDGVIAYNEQLPDGVSKDNACVLDLYADHGDLVKTSFIGGKSKKEKIASYLNFILNGEPIKKELLDFKSSLD